MGPRSSTGLHAKSAVRLSALLGALLLLGFGLAGTHATADGGPPLFFRVTVIEALAGDGPYDATVTIGPIHRRPWYPNTKIVAAELTLGMPSEWIDLSETVSAHADEATAVLSFTSAGSALKGFTRARLELTRDPATAEPLAAIEISDPGGRLGFILPERGTSDTNMPARFLSLLEVSRRHLAASAPLAVSAAERPKHFLASGSCWLFGNWYTDPTIAETEVQSLLNLGYNTMLDLPTEYADRVGVPYGGGADYRPPGVDEGTVDETALRAYYRQRADAIRDGSDSPQRFRMLAMSDEPGWGFPYEADLLNKKPEALERFHAYLREKGITPELLGKSSWDDVTLGASPQPSASLAERRLWYHTIRFSDRDQARRYAIATRALEAEGGTNVLGFVNWNNPGIFYSDLEPWLDCPIYCSHDWFTFSRARGSTCLWLGPGVSEVGNYYHSTFRMWSMILNLLRQQPTRASGVLGPTSRWA